MLGPLIFGSDADAIAMAIQLNGAGNQRIYVFRYENEVEEGRTLPPLSDNHYFSHAQSDGPDLIVPGDRVYCLGRAEDGAWMDPIAVAAQKRMVGNVAAILQEHLI